MAARDLGEALAGMTWSLEPGEFELLGFADAPLPEDLALLERGPAQVIREGGETTLLVRSEDAGEVRTRHADARSEGPLAWVRFEAPMGWEVVGFLARVTGALASAGVPLGAVCGFSRDHLFVHVKYLAAAEGVLEGLFPRR